MMCAGLALAAPYKDIYSGLWGYNSALSCIAVGGVFYVITLQTHLLALTCGKINNYMITCFLLAFCAENVLKLCNCCFPALFCAYMTSAISKLMSAVSKKVSYRVKLYKHHENTQMSLISCVTLCSPLASPFSFHYQPARGLSACRLSSSSSFPLRPQPSADCLCLWSPALRKTGTTRDN